MVTPRKKEEAVLTIRTFCFVGNVVFKRDSLFIRKIVIKVKIVIFAVIFQHVPDLLLYQSRLKNSFPALHIVR